MAETVVLDCKDLSKVYPNGTRAVDSLNLKLYKGEVFGLLGPNGSGKTTTILMMLGLTELSAGEVSVLGYDPLRNPLEVKRRVGYLPDSVGFYNYLTGFENLDYTAQFLGLSRKEREVRITESFQTMGIEKVIDQKVATYSRGMRQRLGLAEVLVKKPEMIILDEPTQGLDPESAGEFLDLIRELKSRHGMTIILSSHLLDQVQSVCDRVGLFFSGKMVVSGSVRELSERILGGKYVIVIHVDGEKIEKTLTSIDGVHAVFQSDQGGYTVECSSDIRPQIAEKLVHEGAMLYSMDMHTRSLDTIYKTFFGEVINEA